MRKYDLVVICEADNRLSVDQALAIRVLGASDMAVLVEFVGTNTTHLRRMAVVQERAHYQDRGFMERLRQVNQVRQWYIEFDAAGKIVPSAETARVIVQVLLNHRLHSELINNDFDVASASPVG